MVQKLSFIYLTGISLVIIFLMLFLISLIILRFLIPGVGLLLLFSKKRKSHVCLRFQTLFLCNICFKFIVKILAYYLRSVIHKLVSPEQNGFLQEHCAYDNIIAAQEISIV